MFKHKIFYIGLSILSLSTLTACNNNNSNDKKDKIKPYSTMLLSPQSASIYSEYPAKLEGIYDIDIRSKIDGYIEKVWVDEGQSVAVGQLLFTISNPQYQQDVHTAKAAIASAEAAVATAALQVKKTKPLVDQDIISDFELEAAQLNLESKKANLAQAKAAYSNAMSNLAYTQIKSPVKGLVGTIPYRIGSYVNANTSMPLTTVSDISKLYAYFSINEKQQIALAQGNSNKSLNQAIEQMPAVQLMLANQELYPELGRLESISGQANTQTGSFNVRALFPNPNNILRSGTSATIKIPTQITQAIIIPQKATAELQDKLLAYIVADSNKVKAVAIKARAIPGGKYFIVDEGLKNNDQLIIEGIGILTEGSIIKPMPLSADSVKRLFEN